MKFTFLVTLLSVLIACSDSNQETTSESTLPNSDALNQQFDQFKDEFLTEFWTYSPAWATYVGYYKYDDKLIVPNESSRQAEKKFIVDKLAEISSYEDVVLSSSNATDLILIKNQLESSLWYMEDFKAYEWNPAQYNVANIFGLILNTNYKPLDERLMVINRRLKNVPEYYQAARENITNPTAEHTRLAIEQNNGALGVFETLIPAKINDSSLSSGQKQNLQTNLTNASDSIKSYIIWLEEIEASFTSEASRSFRIGKGLYETKFKHDIVSNYTAFELYQKAVIEKEKLHASMYEITEQLWPTYLAEHNIPENKLVAIKQMIDHLAQKHIDRESFVGEIRRQMPIIQKFMDDNELLDSDPTRPLVVRETPKYQRGIAGASVDAPGPYDATANTYYNVTPLDDYTPEQAESYLREYNHWILQVLNIHEAIPGHYTQLMHANKSASKIKSIFGNGAMIEGWAVYSERMMLEEGYGNNEAEMWLMYNKWNLRVVINTILDYSVQVLNMQHDVAMNLLLNEGFQEQTEAEGKWRRATLSQVQLTSYFNGYAEIYAFREELKNKMGDEFDLKEFHNQFLSYGNAPVPVIRELMLEELGLVVKQ